MVTVIKSEWHQVEKRYAAEIDIDFLSEVYPDKEDSELEVILQGLQDGTYTIDDLMQDADDAWLDIEWDWLDEDDWWTDRKGGYEVTYEIQEE